MELRLWMRRRQLKDILGNNAIYTGTTPQTLTLDIGADATIDQTWIDYTKFVTGLQKLQITFSTIQTENGELQNGEFVPKKSVSGTLTFEADAKDFLKTWLVDDVAAPLNQIEVLFQDTNCGNYVGYVIKASDLSWCEVNALCTFDLTVKQIDDYYKCIQKTLIADNWQGWFPQDGVPKNKFHPRFSYCTEVRPNGLLVITWWGLGVLFASMLTVMIPLVLALHTIVWFALWPLEMVLEGIDAVIHAFTGSHPLTGVINKLQSIIDGINSFSMGAIIDKMTQQYIESAGCGREHPAPLIRDYISNVCDKCGVSYNKDTIPIFFSDVLTMQHSDYTKEPVPNPHFNACLLTAQVKRGVRRFHSLNIFSAATDPDNTTFWINDNAPVWALSDMLDYLKKVYNAQWRIQTVTDATGTAVPFLYFERKDWYLDTDALYDFSANGADRAKLVEGVCYEQTDVKIPASCIGLYADDAANKCGNEAKWFYNGDPISFGLTERDPLFDGVLDKTTQFGSPKFRLDGASTDYIYDAMQVVVNGQILSPWLVGQMITVGDKVREYGDYAMLLQGETTALPNILIWDGGNGNYSDRNCYLNARAIRRDINIAGTSYTLGKTAYPGTIGGISTPDVNTAYPELVTQYDSDGNIIYDMYGYPVQNFLYLPWEQQHIPQTYVIGSALTFASAVPGVYKVTDYLGFDVTHNAAILVNWPMYYEPHFKGTLWDWFHWIDDPRRNPHLYKNFHLKIPLCCEDLAKLKVTGDANSIRLLDHVLLDTPFYPNGIITEITVCYDDGGQNGVGKYIELKGFV